MKSRDAIIIGGGIIGMSLAISLRREGLSVLVVERGEPGREASHAAAGMLVGDGQEILPALKSFAAESARMYPEFVHELEDESGLKIDLRQQGTILISSDADLLQNADPLTPEMLQSIEPAISGTTFSWFVQGRASSPAVRGYRSPDSETKAGTLSAAFLPERSVDPRTLMMAAIKAARHRGVDISSGSEVTELLVESGRVAGVKTDRTSYSSTIVVNCAGAWAGKIAGHKLPVQPVKGQMLAIVNGPGLQHVIRGDEVYLVPRSDGRIVIGSTLEDSGFNKQVDVDTIAKLRHAAIELVPALAGARQHEAWAGLRPGTPDNLPILGESSTPGYFLATGHYRDGILLAPVTAKAMTKLITGKSWDDELANFAWTRLPDSKGAMSGPA